MANRSLTVVPPPGQQAFWFEPVKPRFRFIDLFAGIGGIRLGLQQSGGQCVYSVEIDKFARRTYIRNFGSCEADDIRDVPLSSPNSRPNRYPSGWTRNRAANSAGFAG